MSKSKIETIHPALTSCQIPTQIWLYPLSPYTIVVYAFLASLPAAKVFSSMTIAIALGISRQRVEDSLYELRELQIVEVTREKISAKRMANKYSVLPEAKWTKPLSSDSEDKVTASEENEYEESAPGVAWT